MKRQFTFRFRASARAAIVVCAAMVASLSAFAQEHSNIISPAPPWQLPSVDGKTVKSSEFQGKVVILNFWATWCVPCREEIPGFIELQKQYGEKGLVVMGVSLDQGGVDLVKRFVERFKINYPVLIADEKIVNDFGSVEAVPTTFIIDKEGRLAGKHVGFAEKDVFEREIKPLL